MGKLERIMIESNHDKREGDLREYARELGCSLFSTYTDGKHLEDILVDRIRQAEQTQKGYQVWVIALISSIASIISALAAWTAILVRR